MVSLVSKTRSVLLRLLLLVGIAVSHCCLMGQTVWAAGVHDGSMSAHEATGPAMTADWHRAPLAHMVCDGADAVATARIELPAPTLAAMSVAVTVALGSPTPRRAVSYRDPPDALPPSRATLQIFLI